MSNRENEGAYDFWGAAPESDMVSTTGILVYVESADSGIDTASVAALGKARELADALGTGIAAILLNSSDESLAIQLIHAGANKVFVASDDRFHNYDTESYCTQISTLIEQVNPEIFMATLSDATRDFFPRIAQRNRTGLVTGCIQVEIDTAERALLATHPIYGGKMGEVITWKQARPQMVLLQAGIFPPPIVDAFRSGEIEKI